MSSLKEQLQQQRLKVAEFAEALSIIKEQPQYQPDPGKLEPLDYLKELMASAQNDQDRAARLSQAEESLKRSQQALVDLEVQWELAETKAAAALPKLRDAAQKVNDLQRQLLLATAELRQVGAESSQECKDVYEKVFEDAMPLYPKITWCRIDEHQITLGNVESSRIPELSDTLPKVQRLTPFTTRVVQPTERAI